VAKKPEGDLGSMAISKATAAQTVPFGAPTPVAPVAARDKSLTVKLDPDLYTRLRDYCYAQERSTGKKLSHQDAMVMGLKMLLDAPRQ
jgi:hypothetical protein